MTESRFWRCSASLDVPNLKIMQFIRRKMSGLRYRLRHVVHAMAGVFPKLHQYRLKMQSREEIFSRAYSTRIWGSSESHSGTGSELAATITIRKELPRLLEKYQIKTMLDAPCGDWNWMRHVDLPVEKYLGVDVVASVVDVNNERYGNDQCSFSHCDITVDDVPTVSFVLCRDCLVHLSNQDIFSVLKNFKRNGIEYLFTNNYPEVTKNVNQFSGLPWRKINLLLPPFNFPEPLETINDGDEIVPGKASLWRLADIELE